MRVSSFSARIVSKLYAQRSIDLSSMISGNLYSIAPGVISSPVEISIFIVCFNLSIEHSIMKRRPSYSCPSIISCTLLIRKETPSSTSIAIISSRIFCTDFLFIGSDFTVVSTSIVERISTPTKEDTRSPPFSTKLSLYFDKETLSRSLSIRYILSIIWDLSLLPPALFFIFAFTAVALFIIVIPLYIVSAYPKFP